MTPMKGRSGWTLGGDIMSSVKPVGSEEGCVSSVYTV
jgi:hypothetical protein